MSYAVEQLNWPRVRACLEADPRVIVPVGALEQHGPHLPLGSNSLIAERVALAVAERCRVLCAPTFYYGVTMGGGPFRGPGLRRKTLHRAINEMVGGWEDLGARTVYLISAHRFEPHLEALLMVAAGPASKSVYDLYQIDVSDLIETDPEGEHAGELETSLMLYLAPDHVEMDQASNHHPEEGALRRYTGRRVPKAPSESGGLVGSPLLATAGKGAAVFERYVEALCRELDAEGS